MAKKNEILLGISLDGDSEVKRKLQEVGEAGKRSLDNIGSKLTGGGRNTALADLQKQATGLRAALAPLAEASGIGGLLSGAGLAGIIGRFATGPGGIVAGLSAALVGLAKFGEGTDRIKGRLEALGDAKGFERLSERAKKLGTDVASLAPGHETDLAQIQRINAANTSVIHPPGFQPGAAQEAASGVRVFNGGQQISPPSLDTIGKADSALFTQVRRDTKSNEEARTIVDDFKKSLSAGLTPDLVRGLPPNARKFLTAQLEKPLAQGFENPEVLATSIERGRIRPNDVSAPRVLDALAVPNKEFEDAAKASRGVTQSFEALTAAAGRLLDKLGGDHAGITKGVDSVAGAVDQKGAEIDQLKAGLERFHAAKGPGETFNAAQDLLLGDEATRNAAAAAALANIQRNRANQSQGLVPESAASSSDVPTDGRRYSRQLNPTQEVGSEVKDAGQDLAAAIKEAAVAVRNSTAGGQPAGRAGGGRITGPGTSKSDSVPIMGSNGEYVINADSAGKIGLANLDYMNATGKLPGAPAPEGEISRRKYKSDFVGLFGGHNFDTPGSYAKGGPIGHFATGGIMPDFSAGAAPSLSDNGAPGGSLGHVEVNLSTNYGDFKMRATPDVARAMAAAARDSADVQTGPRPSWYGRGK